MDKLEIEFTGTTKDGTEIKETVKCSASSKRGQNKAMENQHRKFWQRHPEIITSSAQWLSDICYM